MLKEPNPKPNIMINISDLYKAIKNFIKKLFILLLSLLFLNCGTLYYSIKDGDIPETRKETNDLNLRVLGCDVLAGVLVPVIAGNSGLFLSAFVYMGVDYLTGALFEVKESSEKPNELNK